MDEKKIELKPCPFCGGKAEIYLSRMEQHKFPDITPPCIDYVVYMKCPNCKTTAYLYS